MKTLQWGHGGEGSAHTALVVGGIALALGGAALFGMVAHTWTPFLPQKGAGLSPFDSVARAGSAGPSTALIPKRRNFWEIPFAPRADEFETVAAGHTSAVPAESLTQQESVVAHAEPPPAVEKLVLVDAKPLEREPMRPLLAEARLAEPPAIERGAAEAPVEPKAVVIRVADVRVFGATAAKVPQTGLRIVQSASVDTSAAKAKIEPRRVEPKPAAPKAAPPKAPEPKAVAQKAPEAKPVAPKIAQAKPPAPRVAEAKPAAPKVAEAKQPAPKAAVAPPRIEPKPVMLKVNAVKPPEPQRVELKRVAETKAADARRVEAKRVADMKAVEARFAETKRVAEMKAAEVKLAEVKAAEERLAESQRAFETKAAEARLAETKRAVETTLAEAKLAEAKLAETKRAIDATLSQAKSASAVRPAADARPAVPRFERCDSCGTVTGVFPRYRDRGWEVRVDFGDSGDRAFLYSTDPGFTIGERVRFEAGRITRLYPRRAATYSPT